VVGIVVVSHSSLLAEGLASLAGQMAGPDVRIEPAGGLPNGELGTDEDRVRAAIRAADQGAGVVVLGDLGSAILTVRHVLERHNGNGSVRLVDAPIVEGTVAAAVTASANMPLDDVARSAEDARGAGKL
jgi:phosphoenolpyruvate---glycerone phosphotransferase subunit DhaM